MANHMAVATAPQFTTEQLSIIKATVARDTNNAEFRLFIEVCKYHNLNPFARQIYAVVRNAGNDKRQLCIQTSIDGYRLLAERSGKYAGQTGPQWCGQDGEWKDVWLSDTPPAAARISVFRKDFTQPIWGVAKYKSYAQSTPIWAKMPDVMLAKCAESLALRKAFPAEMSGIYTKEEMDQASDDLPTIDHSTTIVEANEQSVSERKEARNTEQDPTIKVAILGLYQPVAKNKQRAIEACLIRNDQDWQDMLQRLNITEFQTGKDVAALKNHIDTAIKELMAEAQAS